MQNLKSEDGFTLFEALVSLLITTIVMMLLSSGIFQAHKMKQAITSDTVYINQEPEYISGNRQIEWHIFLNQLERYLKNSRNPVVYNRSFTVNEWIEAEEKYNNVIYRRVTTSTKIFNRGLNGGYQPILLGASRIVFTREDEGWLTIENTFDGKKYYYGKIWVDTWIENEVKNK